jgi:hypothetical protein
MMSRQAKHERRVPLSKQPCGIEAFRISGSLDGEEVRAQWDGRWLVVSETLWDYALIAIDVDTIFIEAGLDLSDVPLAEGVPEDLMLAMITCFNSLDVAAYELAGEHYVISAWSRRVDNG